jgi:Flp pilus assembly protein TadG
MNEFIIRKPRASTQPLGRCLTCKGQALVEFTLVFMLLLIVAWIPADFGLAFYTGQQAQNAAREGTRIAAADTALLTQLGGNTSIQCTLPCSGAAAGTILRATADRVSAALIPAATVKVTYPSPDGPNSGCQQLVKVSVNGNYRFFFYRILRLTGVDVPPSTPIQRSTNMRWEHQEACAPF